MASMEQGTHQRQQEFRRLMTAIRQAHEAFSVKWNQVRSSELQKRTPDRGKPSWQEIWRANGIAYRTAASLADRRNLFLRELFESHLQPRYDAFLHGEADAIDAFIDFIEIDVPAFRCGYAKGEFLRKLKKISLLPEPEARLRRYALHLCQTNGHRREIREASRLMIRLANQEWLDQLESLIFSKSKFVKNKVARMMHVVLNARHDLHVRGEWHL